MSVQPPKACLSDLPHPTALVAGIAARRKNPGTMPTVLIVNDHELQRLGYRLLLAPSQT
ncbi:hypothetical protein [Streptomyces phaeochromogenes]|uniref:hypothetical protein n=1 Tax=Streptomyces phaeochromogenes TaxID=1923 RepID=UPI0033C520C2